MRAVRELLLGTKRPVFGLCYRMLSQRQDAEDMAQETFVSRDSQFASVGSDS